MRTDKILRIPEHDLAKVAMRLFLVSPAFRYIYIAKLPSGRQGWSNRRESNVSKEWNLNGTHNFAGFYA